MMGRPAQNDPQGMTTGTGTGQTRPPLEILIAGGGIGGLAAALALATHKIPSHIVEKRAAFSEDGAGIQLGPNATRVLASLGVAEALSLSAGKPKTLCIFDGVSGAALAHAPLGSWISNRHGAPYWTAHRKDLQSALLERAREEPLIELTTGSTILTAMNQAQHIVATTHEGRNITARALIAADGLWSAVRSSCFNTPPLSFMSKTAYRTVIESDRLPDNIERDCVSLWMAPHGHAVHYPVSAGREMALVIILDEASSSKGWSEPVEPAIIASAARKFPRDLRALLEQGSDWRKWSLHGLPKPPTAAKERIALLGDAAHPVLPFLAQGGGLALEDAAVIAACLAETPDDVPQAFATYEKTRKRRSRRVAHASRINGHIYHLNGLARRARNRAITMIPAKRIITGYDWLYAWRAPSASD
jgi:2-polyprenyl-6-methoxyphenol hydroxylase-like FAD-dependent oxidoreductase